MLTSEIKALISQWVEQNRPAPEWTPAFRNQNAPVPDRPFVSLMLTSQIDVGDPSVGAPDSATGIAVLTKDRQITLSVQTHGPGAYDAAMALYDSLHKHGVQVFLFRNGGMAFVQHLTPVNNLSEILQSTNEERAQFDVEFRTGVELDDDVGLIEQVQATGTFDDVTAPVPIDVDAGG